MTYLDALACAGSQAGPFRRASAPLDLDYYILQMYLLHEPIWKALESDARHHASLIHQARFLPHLEK